MSPGSLVKRLQAPLGRLPPWAGPAALALIAALLWSVGAGWRIDADAVRDQVEARRGEVAWMAAAAEKVRQSRAGTPVAGPEEPILVVVDRTVRDFGLHAYLKQVRPDGTAAVGVSLEGAPFEPALRWLYEMHNRYGMTVDALSIDRRGEGVVDLSLGLRRNVATGHSTAP